DLRRDRRPADNAQVLERRKRDLLCQFRVALERELELERVVDAEFACIDVHAHRLRGRGLREERQRQRREQRPHQSFPVFLTTFFSASSFFCSAFSFCCNASRSCIARSLGMPVSFWKRSRSFSSSLLGCGDGWPFA